MKWLCFVVINKIQKCALTRWMLLGWMAHSVEQRTRTPSMLGLSLQLAECRGEFCAVITQLTFVCWTVKLKPHVKKVIVTLLLQYTTFTILLCSPFSLHRISLFVIILSVGILKTIKSISNLTKIISKPYKSAIPSNEHKNKVQFIILNLKIYWNIFPKIRVL